MIIHHLGIPVLKCIITLMLYITVDYFPFWLWFIQINCAEIFKIYGENVLYYNY